MRATKADIEKVARALYAHRCATGDSVDGITSWEDLPEPWREEWTGVATYLDDYGLLRCDLDRRAEYALGRVRELAAAWSEQPHNSTNESVEQQIWDGCDIIDMLNSDGV